MREQYWVRTDDNMSLIFPAGFTAEDLRFTAEVQLEQKGQAGVVSIRGRQEPKAPFFGRQEYLDAGKGVSCTVQIVGAERMTAVYQHKDWWIRPAFPGSFAEIPERTQLLLLKGGETYLAVLAVCGREYRTDLSGAEDGICVTTASNCGGRNALDDVCLSYAWGEDPYQCCEKAVLCVLELTGRTAMLRRNRRYPAMFEKLGWCSWDAFYHKVSAQGICDKLAELQEKQVPVKWALIDDGWLDADYDRQVLLGLDAARDKFPQGLGQCVRRMKQEFGMEQVGVWHAVMGYWNGVQDKSQAHTALEEGCERLPDGRIVPAAEAGKAFRFYDVWHEYLRNRCGIDFVKVDGQSAISLFHAGRRAYGRASAAVQTGLNASAALHFDNAVINCMGMASEDMWNRPSSAVSRSSDDFVPEVAHGFREHAVQNAFNSLLQGQFYWNDWDMFWSDHAENWQNAVLRAVSGGPVYTSDPVGRTDPAYILPLIRKDGTVIRCEDIGTPTCDCLFEDPVKKGGAFKLFNRYKNGYVVAVFNIGEAQKQCGARLRISDIPGLGGRDWYVCGHRSRALACLTEKTDYTFTLDQNDAEIFLLLPAGDVCPVGILEKFIPAGCITPAYERDDRLALKVSDAGTFGLFTRVRPREILIDGRAAAWAEQEAAGTRFVTVSCAADAFIEIIYVKQNSSGSHVGG